MNAAEVPNPDIWIVRAGRNGIYAKHFLKESVVAVGWGEIGAISPNDSDEDIKQRFLRAYPNEKAKTRMAWESQVKRFVRNVQVGDAVATYDHESRLYHLGAVSSPAEMKIRNIGDEERGEFVRRVEWTGTVSRDTLSARTRNSLGSSLTLFTPSPQASEELRRLSTITPADSHESVDSLVTNEEFDIEEVLQEYIDRSEQFIEDKIASLDWRQVQELVAGILRAMDYRTRVSSPGPDRGVDVFASPDGLGLAEPRVFVEVKHRTDRIGSQDVRAFIGGRQPGDRCLYVSTGGFTTDARYEADRSQIPLTLIAMPELRELVVDYYESLDTETRALVPLRRVYWPIAERIELSDAQPSG